MEDRKFKPGDIVTVSGLSSCPAMSVQYYTTMTSALEPAYKCSWFDNDHRSQEGVFHEDTLTAKEEGQPFPASNFL